MNHLAHEIPAQTGAERLQYLYAGMIGSAAAAAWDQVEELWDRLGTVEVSQGDVRGRLRPDAVLYELGGLPGFTIRVALETDDGPRQIELGLDGTEPRFTFEAPPTPRLGP